jgi:aminocarboxymuconate-semialdehyde decarboxylase
MTIIDFHNHFYPPAYLEAIQAGPSNIKVTVDDDSNPLLHYPGDYNIVVPGHRDVDFRAQILDKAGVDMQVLTMTTPGTHVESPQRAVELARIVNDEFAAIMQTRGERFTALGTLPLNDPQASVAEMERSWAEHGFKGFQVFSNIDGVELTDPRFWPLYAKASDLELILDIHPTFPAGVEAMSDYWLMPLLGFTFDTTLAAAKLVFSGVAERYPGIKWILNHAGGAIPYLAERLDRGYEAFKECRAHISKPPSTYLKNFYFDAVNFDPQALQLCVDFAGAEHVLAGSDYPHQIGSLAKMLSTIDQLKITAKEKKQILGGNARRLLGL